MQQLRASRLIVAALGTVLTAILVTFLLTLVGPDWSAFAPASCAATRCFCEMPRIGSLIL
jgi:hypothetical protein